MKLKVVVSIAAVLVFLICVYLFLLGNGVFDGKFENEPLAWYFLAKGIFCGLSMHLLRLIVDTLRKRAG